METDVNIGQNSARAEMNTELLRPQSQIGLVSSLNHTSGKLSSQHSSPINNEQTRKIRSPLNAHASTQHGSEGFAPSNPFHVTLPGNKRVGQPTHHLARPSLRLFHVYVTRLVRLIAVPRGLTSRVAEHVTESSSQLMTTAGVNKILPKSSSKKKQDFPVVAVNYGAQSQLHGAQQSQLMITSVQAQVLQVEFHGHRL